MTQDKMPAWVLDLKPKVHRWIEKLMAAGEPYGRFRFADKGCVYLPCDIISVHFAADIYKKLHLDKSLTEGQRKQWMDLSVSWRDPVTGEVRDPDGVERGVPDNDGLEWNRANLRRCLNRCCKGVFKAADEKPVLQQDVRAFTDMDQMFKVFDAMPWETNSWSAGANTAHYLLAMMQWQNAGCRDFDQAIDEAVRYLYAKQNPETGTFGGNRQDASCLMGGILKVYIRLFGTMNLEIKYPERIIDTTVGLLQSGELKGNCPAHNALIVLLMCSNFTDYRKDEIRREAFLSLERDIHPLLKEDGAFCCNPQTSEYSVWGVKMVESGYDQGEMHSTNIMLNSVRVVAELLDVEELLNYEPSTWKRKQ